jgi:hypothetical protein
MKLYVQGGRPYLICSAIRDLSDAKTYCNQDSRCLNRNQNREYPEETPEALLLEQPS